jgi:hypothetical protein
MFLFIENVLAIVGVPLPQGEAIFLRLLVFHAAT